MEIVVSYRGAVVIPEELREQWGLAGGTRVRVISTAAGILISPVFARNAKAVLDGLGLAGYKGRRIAIDEMNPISGLATLRKVKRS
jgi:AbrB family looped-hinge helix DNA binding protein